MMSPMNIVSGELYAMALARCCLHLPAIASAHPIFQFENSFSNDGQPSCHQSGRGLLTVRKMQNAWTFLNCCVPLPTRSIKCWAVVKAMQSLSHSYQSQATVNTSLWLNDPRVHCLNIHLHSHLLGRYGRAVFSVIVVMILPNGADAMRVGTCIIQVYVR
jgi:hypothetical protein